MALGRRIDPATLAAMRGAFCPVTLVEIDWPETPVCAHSGVGDLVWAGRTWLGLGPFGGLEMPAAGTGMAATVAGLTFTAPPAAMRGDIPPEAFDLLAAMDAPIRNRRGAIWFGVVTKPAGTSLIGQPFPLFLGRMDALRYAAKAEGADEDGSFEGADLVETMNLDVASGPGARDATVLLHSYEDQIDKFPGDTGGRHLIGIEVRTAAQTWPQT